MKLPEKPADLARAETSLLDIRDSLRANETALADIEATMTVVVPGKVARDLAMQPRRAELERRIERLRVDEESTAATVADLKHAFTDVAREPLKAARRDALLRYADALSEATDAWSEAEEARAVLQYIGEPVRKSVPCPYLIEAEKSARVEAAR